jgi:hypothetical protein
MRMPSIARISIATGTAALCMAVAGPAMACIPAESSGSTHSADSLAAAIANADATIGNEQVQLDGWAARFLADPNLSVTQKAAFAAAIATASADLQAQKAQIDAALTIADVTADLQSPAVDAAKGTVSVALAITSAEDALVSKANGLTALAAKVIADAGLSAGQQADVAAVIAAAQVQVQDARNAVNAATTTAAVTAAQQSSALRSAVNAVSLRLAIDHADHQIDAVQAELAGWLAQIVADPTLTDMQKSDATTKITAAQTWLGALRTKVDAATSAGQVAAELKAAHFADHAWLGDDPAKLSRSDRSELVAAKRGANCGKSDPAAVSTKQPVVTAVVKTNNAPHQQAPKAQLVSSATGNGAKAVSSTNGQNGHDSHGSRSGHGHTDGHRH